MFNPWRAGTQWLLNTLNLTFGSFQSSVLFSSHVSSVKMLFCFFCLWEISDIIALFGMFLPNYLISQIYFIFSFLFTLTVFRKKKCYGERESRGSSLFWLHLLWNMKMRTSDHSLPKKLLMSALSLMVGIVSVWLLVTQIQNHVDMFSSLQRT